MCGGAAEKLGGRKCCFPVFCMRFFFVGVLSRLIPQTGDDFVSDLQREDSRFL